MSDVVRTLVVFFLAGSGYGRIGRSFSVLPERSCWQDRDSSPPFKRSQN